VERSQSTVHPPTPRWVIAAVLTIAVIAVVGLWAAASEPDPRCATVDSCWNGVFGATPPPSPRAP
jgi:hypothetical protein